MNGRVEPETPPDSPSMDVGVGKPPHHHLTSIRHCASSARIAAAAASSNFGLDLGTLSLISPTDVRPGFLPVFRSGSCADIGPKSCMEDEHVCVDNLIEAPPASLRRAPSTGVQHLKSEASRASKLKRLNKSSKPTTKKPSSWRKCSAVYLTMKPIGRCVLVSLVFPMYHACKEAAPIPRLSS